MKYVCDHCEKAYLVQSAAEKCELRCAIAQDYIPTINHLKDMTEDLKRLIRFCYKHIPAEYDQLRKDVEKYIPHVDRVKLVVDERCPKDRAYVIPNMNNIIG
jgi:hypothetical protein